jgi:hypothetical protein
MKNVLSHFGRTQNKNLVFQRHEQHNLPLKILKQIILYFLTIRMNSFDA